MDKIAQPFFRLTKVHTSFMGYCVKCYNKIPCDILKLNERKFKNKSTLCKQAYYKLDDYIQDKNAWNMLVLLHRTIKSLDNQRHQLVANLII